MTDFRYTRDTIKTIRDMIRRRLPRAEMERQLGCESSTLDAICHDHGIELPKYPPVMIEAVVGADALATIAAEAARRGLPIDVLAGRCLELVAGGNLFRAVLDR